MLIRLLGLVLLIISSPSVSADDLFPDQLDLSTALQISKPLSSTYLRKQAALTAARNQQNLISQRKNWRAGLTLEGRTASRANAQDDAFSGHSRGELQISKLLWDFGQSTLTQRAAQQGIEAAELGIANQLRLQRIEIMQRFFDVLLADYAYTVKDETMTLAYLSYSRADDKKQRYDSVSELEVLEKQSNYLGKLVVRNEAQQRQRQSRLELALVMGWPDAKPNQLIEPALTEAERAIPNFDQLLESVREFHPKLNQLNAKLESEKRLLNSESASQKPQLSLDLHAGEYERSYASKDRARAALRLEWPLLLNKTVTERQISTQNRILELEAQGLELEYEIRREVLHWIQRLEALEQRAQHGKVEIEYRERALDKSRLLYELEVRTEIGKAQADMAMALFDQAKVKFERALIWEQVDMALNQPSNEAFLQ